VRENSSFAPLGLASFFTFSPTPYGVGCILSPLRGYKPLPKTPAAKFRTLNPKHLPQKPQRESLNAAACD
jgi:hypothetical protein